MKGPNDRVPGAPLADAIRVTPLEDGIACVTFDQPGGAANVLSQALMTRLGEIVEQLAADASVRGVVFDSAKPSIFIAGADVKEFTADLSDAEIDQLIQRGQQVFQGIAGLRVPTVAAIHGACMGGGCELALACTARVASDDGATKIGLPETMLGIIPAWGGSTRMPRLIGLPKALGAILGGERMSARKALAAGLVDRVVPREHLLRAARQLILAGPPERRKHALTNNAVAARIIARQARKATLAKTQGHYPAPLVALNVVVKGLGGSVAASLDRERAAVLELIKSPVTGNLVRIFLLTERAKRLRVVPDGTPAPVGRIAVIGAGVMGAGIAQWAAARGHGVILQDIAPEPVAKGIKGIADLFAAGVRRKALDKGEARRALDRVAPAATPVPLPVDLVVEAAAERLDIKREIFRSLEERSRPDTILATNTSSLPVTEIAAGLRHPERVVGIHFFNPVHKMQLVEVVVGEQTDPQVADRAVKWVQDLGKLPVVCKDSPGFLVNRVLMPYLVEAGLLYADGAAPAAIDRAMTAFGMPMGPLRLIDEVGLDIAVHAAEGMAGAFQGRLPSPAALQPLVERGLLGRKSGKGFYVYDGGKGKRAEPRLNPELAGKTGTGARPAARLTPAELAERMVLPTLNEAARCLEEGIVQAPEDVDLGMILGTGWAPFRGGPIRYIDTLGAAEVVRRLEALAASVGERYEPCALLRTMAAAGRPFYGGAHPAPGATRPSAVGA